MNIDSFPMRSTPCEGFRNEVHKEEKTASKSEFLVSRAVSVLGKTNDPCVYDLYIWTDYEGIVFVDYAAVMQRGDIRQDG